MFPGRYDEYRCDTHVHACVCRCVHVQMPHLDEQAVESEGSRMMQPYTGTPILYCEKPLMYSSTFPSKLTSMGQCWKSRRVKSRMPTAGIDLSCSTVFVNLEPVSVLISLPSVQNVL